MPHRRHTSTSSAIIAAVFAVQAAADTVTLTQFQRITGFPEACTQAYDTPISGCTTNDFKDGNACSQACVAGLEKESTLLNTECLGISTSSSTLIGLFFEGKGVEALCPRVASSQTTVSTSAVAATTKSTTSPAAAATTSSQNENTSSLSNSISSTSTTSSSSTTSDTSSSSESSTSATESSSSSDLSSSSTTSSSSATAEATTFVSTTISQTSFNIPLTSSTTAANTAPTAFGGDVGNLNGPPSKGSNLRISSIFMSMAAGLAVSFLMWM